jgi:hypothetical protein
MIVFVPIMDQMNVMASAGVYRAEADIGQEPVQHAVRREELQRHHADDNPGDGGRQEVDGPEEAPASHVLVQQRRDDQRDADRDRHSQKQQRVVLQHPMHDRVAERGRVGARADPDRRRVPVPSRHGVADRLHDRSPQQGADEQDRRHG